MTHLPDLERELVAAAERRRRHRGITPLRGRSFVLVVGAALAAAGGAAAAVTTVFDREPPTPEAVEAHQPQGPVTFQSEAEGVDGRPWVLRSWRERSSDQCVQPGRRVNDRFGLIFAGHPEERRFVPLSYTDGPACGAGTAHAVHLLDRIGVPNARLVTTLVYGIAPEGLAPGELKLTLNGVRHPISFERQTYLAVLEGDVPRGGIRVTLTTASGEHDLADFSREDPPAPEATIVNSQDVAGSELPWAQRAWTLADGQRCAISGQLVDGFVGVRVAGLPGAFIEAPSTDAKCARPPKAEREGVPGILTVRTKPAEPNAGGSRSTAGFLIGEGLVTGDVRAVRLSTSDGASRDGAIDARTSHFLVVAPVDLVNPYAEDVADRIAVGAAVEFELNDGSVVRRPLE